MSSLARNARSPVQATANLPQLTASGWRQHVIDWCVVLRRAGRTAEPPELATLSDSHNAMPQSIITEPLAGQPVGRRARIQGFALPEGVRLRLLEMGLTEGIECRVVRYAPLGDPMEVKVRGYFLSLRAADAEGVLVEPLA